MTWQPIVVPAGLGPPEPITVRAQPIPARHYFPEHSHGWNQFVYAITGVLTVSTDAESFVITPDEAVWLPTGIPHRVGSLLGAEFRSLWIARDAGECLPETPTVVRVSPLLRALIAEAAAIDGQGDMRQDDMERDDQVRYAKRVTVLLLDQLVRARALTAALPWPRKEPLTILCEALYLDPADDRGSESWARQFGISPRTLARHFEAELGMSLRSWRRRVRLFRSIELLGGGMGVTQVAMELGYGSTSAFVYAFRTQMGCSPRAYIRWRDGRSRSG